MATSGSVKMTPYPRLRDLPSVAGKVGWPWTKASPSPSLTSPWPRITIVIPSFNQGRFLEETIRSVLLQSYPNLELIVIDGGSEDSSLEVVGRYEPWLAYSTSEPDSGQSEAINKGFDRATGDIMTFLGSDDVYEPGTLQDVAQRWGQHPGPGVIVGAFRYMDESSRRSPEIHPPRLPGPGPHDLTLLDTSTWRLHQVSTFYSRQALDTVGRRVREDLHYTMDRELLYRVCHRYPTVLAKHCYAAFRLHSEGKSTAMILPMWFEMADLHLLDTPPGEDRSVRRRRRKLWRERRSRAWVKLANSGGSGWAAAAALMRALWYRPRLLGRRQYWASWLAACGILPIIRRFRGVHES